MGQMYLQRFANRDGVSKSELDQAWAEAFKAFAQTGNWGGVDGGVKHHQTYGTGWGGLVLIEVEDQCGGIPEGVADPFKPFTERRKHDRTGLGLGLSIARKAVRMHGGEVTYRNLPGIGCVFVIELPLAYEEATV